ncbi:PREDICTED: basic salivary proline-rich protein 4-like [Dipodomys ordii]|uniref:Basic salivary proline-rich protein 4-like n=1 Tax=Dipodomys ordii TaxID=10020 RepID=A0A1S3FDC4_DIPOR|nr:PREDICTED: basic salivary proline-rich protein 4-like [Dipodomys ordii]
MLPTVGRKYPWEPQNGGGNQARGTSASQLPHAARGSPPSGLLSWGDSPSPDPRGPQPRRAAPPARFPPRLPRPPTPPGSLREDWGGGTRAPPRSPSANGNPGRSSLSPPPPGETCAGEKSLYRSCQAEPPEPQLRNPAAREEDEQPRVRAPGGAHTEPTPGRRERPPRQPPAAVAVRARPPPGGGGRPKPRTDAARHLLARPHTWTLPGEGGRAGCGAPPLRARSAPRLTLTAEERGREGGHRSKKKPQPGLVSIPPPDVRLGSSRSLKLTAVPEPPLAVPESRLGAGRRLGEVLGVLLAEKGARGVGGDLAADPSVGCPRFPVSAPPWECCPARTPTP